MPSLEKTQLIAHLETVYRPLIRRRVNSNDHRENLAFPSRALSSYTIERLAKVTPQVAADGDVDGGGDEGIDSYYYDKAKGDLYLIQGKAGGDGDGQPSLQDCLRFIDGINQLLTGDLTHFTELSEAQQTEIRSALQNTDLSIFVILAHFGGPLADDRTRRFESLKTEYDNSFGEERLYFINFDLRVAHAELMDLRAAESIDTTVALTNYAKHEDNGLSCVYGRIKATDLKEIYLSHGNALFEKNVRFFRGDNSVNNAVKTTLEDFPEKLFYLNNGITALCRKFTPTPETARNPGNNGAFAVEGLSVVNGAQTIGSIGDHLADDNEEASVLIKIIKVEEGQEALGDQISRSTNFQTTVESIDFLSTHPVYAKLAATLEESCVTFHYKRSVDYSTNRLSGNRFNLVEAIEARICAKAKAADLRHIKTQPSELYNTIRTDNTGLFSDSLSARTLWREVQLCRITQERIDLAKGGEQTSRGQQFFTHGAVFLKALALHHFRSLISKDELEIQSAEATVIGTQIDDLLVRTHDRLEANFSTTGKTWNNVFRTQQDIVDALRTNRDALNATPATANA